MQTETRSATGVPVVLDAAAIAVLPLETLGSFEGVVHRVLWRTPSSMAGVLTVRAGHRLGTHSHRANHHHIWVLEGSARMLGTLVEPGSYVHVPVGVEHDIDATATAGCTVFYLYLRGAD